MANLAQYYYPKSEIIEAEQYLIGECYPAGICWESEHADWPHIHSKLKTLVRVCSEDWIIRKDGEFLLCNPKTFETLYALVD